MLISTMGRSSLPVVVAQPDERHANRTASVLKWYDFVHGTIMLTIQLLRQPKSYQLLINNNKHRRCNRLKNDACIIFKSVARACKRAAEI